MVALFGIVGTVIMIIPFWVVTKIINKILIKKFKDNRAYLHMQEDEMKYKIYGDYILVYFLSYLLIMILITIPCIIKLLNLLETIL